MKCKCGCGKEIVFKRHHRWRNIRYIQGHNLRGKKYTDKKIKKHEKSWNYLRGKTWEEVYGKEKAEEMKKKWNLKNSSKNGLKRKYKGDLFECRTCKKFKPKEDFSKNKNRGDGLLINCRKCSNKISLDYHYKNLERLKEYSKNYDIKNKRICKGCGKEIHRTSIRCFNCAMKGENHPLFNNWSSREPYGKQFSPELKIEIKKRDNFTCQECGKLQNQLKRKLFIHHIDYNKKNNSIFNLISLCNSCHTKTNFNRKHWIDYFKMKIFLKELFNPQNIKVFNEDKQLIAMERLR